MNSDSDKKKSSKHSDEDLDVKTYDDYSELKPRKPITTFTRRDDDNLVQI